jgi:hypothetical protein
LTLVALTSPAAAERPIDPTIELSGLGGAAFGGTIKLEDRGKIELGTGWAVEGIFGIRLRSDEGKLIVVSYSHSRSTAKFHIDGDSASADLDIGYLQVGGEIDSRMAPYFTPFFGLTVGATLFSPTWNANSEWFFSAGLYGGVKVPINDHVGLRFQGGMLGTLISGNSEIFLGPNGIFITIDEVSGPIGGYVQAGLYYAF